MRAREQKRELRESIFEEMSSAIMLFDEENRVIDLNRAAMNLLGSESSDILGMEIDTLGLEWLELDEFDSNHATSSREVKHGKVGHEREYEIELITYDGDGVSTGNKALIIRDITVYKRAMAYWEDQYKRYSRYLERLVEQRTKQLRDAERMAAIGELASMVGHDIRNPLTAISGATYFLKNKLGLGTDERSREMLDLIEENIEESNKIVSDLLEYSRDIQLDKSATDLTNLVKASLSSIDISENVMVVNDVGNEYLEIDGQYIKRVFVNIIRNAVDAMPEGGTLTITSERSIRGLEVCFKDTGIGIPEEIIDDIWKPLFTTKPRGMGFGLAICKRIMECHGGEVTVESQVGEGTSFIVVFPIDSGLQEEALFKSDEIFQKVK
jgi:PAS domain S-box-containing protein